MIVPVGGSTLIVDKLHILTTEFVEPGVCLLIAKRVVGTYAVSVGRRHYIPNSSIFRGTVINLKRSNNGNPLSHAVAKASLPELASLGFVVQVSMDTPTEKLIELKVNTGSSECYTSKMRYRNVS